MRTGKSISNIGYVRPEYFKQIANTLRKSGVIGTCYWIAHKGEDGDKDHIHLVLLGGQRPIILKVSHPSLVGIWSRVKKAL